MNKKFYINGLIALAVLGVLTGGFFFLFEKAEKTIHTPGSAEARENPFLAAERFLSASGIQAESVKQRDVLINPPPADSLIVVNHMGGNLPRKREDRLIAWIENGGTLVMTHNHPWREKLNKSGNSLLDRLSIRLHNARDMQAAENSEPSVPAGADKKTTAPENKKAEGAPESSGPSENSKKNGTAGEICDRKIVRVPIGSAVAEIQFIARHILEDAGNTATETYAGKTGNHIIARKMGRGRLIVLSDNQFLRNDEIGNRDHALFLSYLAGSHPRAWLLYNTVMPPFFAIVFDKAPYVFFAMTLLAAAYIGWLTIRIGPRHKTPDHTSRNISEHLLSAGHFIREHDAADTLIRSTRRAIRKKIAVPHRLAGDHSNPQAPAPRTLKIIADRTGLPAADVEFALTAAVEHPAALVDATVILQQIDAALRQNTSNPKL